MTVKRTEDFYVCNNCQDVVTEETGVGFNFKSDKTEVKEGPLQSTEEHICSNCLSAIYALAVRLRQMV